VSRTGAGTGANVAITSLMGNGEVLRALSDEVAGQILNISLTSGGAGYEYIPQLDLTTFGDGTATANAQIGSSFVELPGRWTTSDSIISSSERRLQGADFYNDFSYVTSSLTEFDKYKKVLLDLLHPAGYVNYAFLNKTAETGKNVSVSSIETTNTISGLVSITNNSIFVDGTGTLFNVANDRGILSIGSSIAINGQIRVIDSILSNTNLSVDSAFTTTTNAQTLIILT
jgi:hypothetical protein